MRKPGNQPCACTVVTNCTARSSDVRTALCEGSEVLLGFYKLPQPNAAQEAIGLLCHKGTLVARDQLGVHQDYQVLFCQAAFQPARPSLFWCLRLFLPRGRTWHFPVLNFTMSLLAHFSSLSRSFWATSQPAGLSVTLAHPYRPPDTLAWFPAHWDGQSWVLKRQFSKFNQLPWTALLFRALSHEILPWTAQSLLSRSPGLWSCYLPCSFFSGTWTPPSHGQPRLFPAFTYPTSSFLFVKVRCHEAPLHISSSITYVRKLCHCPPQTSWIACAPPCCPSSRYQSG